jgi:hypothetical protein
MTSPKIGTPEVFLLSTAVTSMFACATYSRWTRSSRSKADVISIIRKASARPHQTRADDLARPKLIPARNHYSNPYIGLFRVIRNRLDSDVGVLNISG